MGLNLVADAWLPVQDVDGRVTRVSLRSALLGAHEVRGLSVDAPTLRPAVLRQTLLPLLVSALGPPRSSGEWGKWFSAGRFSKEHCEVLEGYLEEWGERFNLLDEQWPFAQVGGLEALSGKTKPVTLLIPSVATGNNVPMFTAFSEAYPFSLAPEDAALWLLHTHCWDTAAIKTGAKGDTQAADGKTTGNPTGPLGQLGVVVPEGTTLYETLLLNTPIIPDGLRAGDRPQWQSPAGPEWRTRPAHGLLDAWTWQARRIRLIGQEEDEGVRISRVLVCGGDRLTSVRQEYEWHTTWTYTGKPKKRQEPLRPLRHRTGEHAWQGLSSLLALGRGLAGGDGPRTSGLLEQVALLEEAGHLPVGLPLRLHTCGIVYGSKSATVEDVVADILPLPTAALASDARTQHAVLEAAQQAELVGHALNRLSADLRRAAGSDPLPWDKGQRPALSFLQATDVPMRRLLRGLQHDAGDEERIEQGMAAWEQVLHRLAWNVAEELLVAAPPTTFLGRCQKEGGPIHRAAKAQAGFAGALKRVLTRETGFGGGSTMGEDEE